MRTTKRAPKTTKRKKGYFSISAVAQMLSIHQQTIRMYEKEGLICPKRSAGNTRLFAEEDIANLEEIIHLTHSLGINLAGVEMILRLQKQIKKLQGEVNKVFKNTQEEFERERLVKTQAAQVAAQKIAQLKQKAIPLPKSSSSDEPDKNR